MSDAYIDRAARLLGVPSLLRRSDDARPVFANSHRSNWVRLRTLVVLRWFAVAGQIAAVVVAGALFDLRLQTGLIAATIGASAISNLMAMFIFPENRRLSEAEMATLLVFDIAQLALLLFLTGGINNPFAILILGPVTISATALRMRSLLLVGAVAILLVSVITRWHMPLQVSDGRIIGLPQDLTFGFWMSMVIAVVFLSAYARWVTMEVNAMSDALVATQMALAREQQLTDIGGVVAAAAHEMGTPLATITLVAAELLDEVRDRPELREDVALIRSQADRCRDILRAMGRTGTDDTHLRHAPVARIVEEAAEPHGTRGKRILWDVAAEDGTTGGGAEDGTTGGGAQPVIARRPEIVHGLRNLVQNAVDFAATTVWIDIRWTEQRLMIRIADDGPGFPADVLPRVGDPFLRRRGEVGAAAPARPNYEGMGLGLFISKTLLERSLADLSFANGIAPGAAGPVASRRGAIVLAMWWRADLDERSPPGHGMADGGGARPS